ncbi:MAG: YwaF family protein [Oscillospiraceae bacterium]|nr:YwaF family protein [Oscillospiraceae bacterium]
MSELSEFWYTEYTMSKTYGYDYTVFNLFDRTHITWLVLCLVFTVGISVLYRKSGARLRRRLEISVAMLALFLEVSRIIEEILTDQWRVGSLPLQLCSISAFICAWYGIHPNKLAANILYALCLPGAAVALLSPTWCALPIANFFHIDSEMLHILLVCYPVMLLAGGFKPEIKMLPKVLAVLAGMLVVIYSVNKILGTNFFFINDPLRQRHHVPLHKYLRRESVPHRVHNNPASALRPDVYAVYGY